MESYFSLLFKYRANGFKRYFRTNKIAKSITIMIFLGILGALAWAIFMLFRWEFALFASDAYLRVALPLYFYEGLLLVIFLLVFVSSFVSAMFALFRGGNDVFVMASPRFSLMFWKGYLRLLLSSLWPIVVIMIPAFMGSSVASPIGIMGSILFLLSVCFMAGIAVSLAIALFMMQAALLYIIARYTAWKKIFSFGNAALLGVLTIAGGMAYACHRVGIGDIVSVFAPQDSTWANARVDIILDRFSIFPSHLAALTFFDARWGYLGSAAVVTAGLALLFVMSAIVIWRSSLIYLPLWQLFQEGRGTLKKLPVIKDSGPIRFPRYFKGPLGALFEKEGLVFFREMKSALWFFFLFALWAVQIVLEFFIRVNLIKYGENLSAIVAQVEALQLGTAIYFVSAFILRFVFPSFSGEQKTSWILGASPLRTESVFWGKLLFYGVLFLALGAIFCAVNFAIIQMPITAIAAFVAFVFLMIVLLVALGLGLGAIFPNFESNDPEILSTSLPGLGFIFSSLLYGGFGAYFFYRFLASGVIGPVIDFDIVTVLLTIMMIVISLRAVKRFEFVRDR